MKSLLNILLGDFFIFCRPILIHSPYIKSLPTKRLRIYMVTPTEFRPGSSTNRGLFLPVDVAIRTIWQARFRVMMIAAVFSLPGMLVAWLQQPEFRSEARIMPEMNTGASDIVKRLSSVAGFATSDFSDTEHPEAIRPDLYPNVLQSTPFVLFLIEQPITTTRNGPLQTIGQFLLPDKPGWSLRHLLSFGKTNADKGPAVRNITGPIHLSERQQELAEEISERVTAKLDTRSGIITISAKMPDAQAAATVAQLTMNYLTRYVTNYRTGKARQDLNFYTQQLAEARQRYQRAQLNLFRYNDNHKAIVIQATTLDRHRMEAELSIAQTVYTELSRQFEQAKLKVQERTPIFTVLEPPVVPLKRLSPKRTVIVLLFALAGLALGVLSVLTRQAEVVRQLRRLVTAETQEYQKPF